MITLDPHGLYPMPEIAKMFKVDIRTVRRAARRISKRKGALKTPWFSAAEIRSMMGIK